MIHTWLEQWTAPYMEVMGEKSMTCTSPLKCGSFTICRALAGFTLMMRLLPRLSTLHPYICSHTAVGIGGRAGCVASLGGVRVCLCVTCCQQSGLLTHLPVSLSSSTSTDVSASAAVERNLRFSFVTCSKRIEWRQYREEHGRVDMTQQWVSAPAGRRP